MVSHYVPGERAKRWPKRGQKEARYTIVVLFVHLNLSSRAANHKLDQKRQNRDQDENTVDDEILGVVEETFELSTLAKLAGGIAMPAPAEITL